MPCSPFSRIQVGNELGALDPEGARLSAIVAVSVAPFAWALSAMPLLTPSLESFLIEAFSDPQHGVDEQLRVCLVHMFQVRRLCIRFLVERITYLLHPLSDRRDADIF